MTFDLDEARRLHERDPERPSLCRTCPDELWPCPTAIALGATGRSEWTDAPPPDPDTLRRVRIPTASWYYIGPGITLAPSTTVEIAFDTKELCPSDACTLQQDHEGNHLTIHSTYYKSDTKAFRCRTIHCVLDIDHQGTHLDDQGDWFETPED